MRLRRRTYSLRIGVVLGCAIASVACGDDEAGSDSLDAALDGRTEAPLDGQTADVQLDGSVEVSLDAFVEGAPDAQYFTPPPPPRTGYGCELDQDYAFVEQAPPQGLSTRWSYRLERGGRFESTADNTWKVTVPYRVCTVDLPPCGGDMVDGADLAAALTHPGVLTAFQDQSIVGGGSLVAHGWGVTRADGKRIVIRQPCGDAGACVPVPPALEALSVLLDRVVAELNWGGSPRTCRDVPYGTAP